MRWDVGNVVDMASMRFELECSKCASSITTCIQADNGDGVELSQIREKVLELLKKHDQAKVNRVDILMEKFKGKEALLLDKMTQRYEGDSTSAPTSVQQRNVMALERHQERMRKIREKKGLNK